MMNAANDTCFSQFGRRPFTVEYSKARRIGGIWKWGDSADFGHNGYSAYIECTGRGRVLKTVLRVQTDINDYPERKLNRLQIEEQNAVKP
jgi:hypothetical protein